MDRVTRPHPAPVVRSRESRIQFRPRAASAGEVKVRRSQVTGGKAGVRLSQTDAGRVSASGMKRANPFGDPAPLQRKVRVTQKEINEGVFGEKYKREVYEKTKKMLFNGAQAFMGDMWNGNSEENCPVVHPGSPSEAPSPQSGPGDVCNEYEGCDLLCGQTFLGSDGRLMKASLHLPRITPSKQTAANCFFCLKFSNTKEQCSQCDRLMCQRCCKVCDSCMRMCCSVCSVADYNESYDKVICYDCVSYRG